MREITASEASRNFSAVLDSVGCGAERRLRRWTGVDVPSLYRGGGASHVPVDRAAVPQHEFGEDVIAIRQWPRLHSERVVGEERNIGCGCRCSVVRDR